MAGFRGGVYVFNFLEHSGTPQAVPKNCWASAELRIVNDAEEGMACTTSPMMPLSVRLEATVDESEAVRKPNALSRVYTILEYLAVVTSKCNPFMKSSSQTIP
jgi:hypothetical protein